MSALDTGPCEPWPLLCERFPAEADQDLRDMAARIATEVLWLRTKRQFGQCEVTLRPCRKDCAPAWPWIPSSGWWDVTGMTWPWPAPALVGGKWLNIACGQCSSGCSCSTVHEVRLPYPVAEILEVLVDGVALDPSAYRVDEWSLLVRLDGHPWPLCNDLNLDDTEPGTWSVRARYGAAVPELGQLAAGELASEIAKRCVGASGCLLPSTTVKQVDRQGVRKVFFDSDEAFKRGKVGLYWSDMFIASVNPTGTGTASIIDIDGNRPRRVNT